MSESIKSFLCFFGIHILGKPEWYCLTDRPESAEVLLQSCECGERFKVLRGDIKGNV
jgi:hypothetical protein